MLELRTLTVHLLLLAFYTTIITAIPPIRPPRIDPPEPLVVPKPVSPHLNPDKPYVGEDVPQAQQPAVASNMQRLEDRLEAIQHGLDIGTELIQAIFPTKTESSSWQNTATMTSKPTQSASATKTLNMSLFGACQSYASTLSSCASATTNFFALDSMQQASCACYTLSPAASGSCASVPTLATASVYAEACQRFFSVNGFSEIASVMSDSGNVADVGFCGMLNAELFAQNLLGKATRATELPLTLEPTACTVSRSAVATPTARQATGGVAGLRGQLDGCGVLTILFALLTAELGMVEL